MASRVGVVCKLHLVVVKRLVLGDSRLFQRIV